MTTLGVPYEYQCEAEVCRARTRDIRHGREVRPDPCEQVWLCRDRTHVHYAHAMCAVVVTDVFPGTPEWDESERILEIQRRNGG